MSTISRVIKKAWEEINKPEEFVKGEEFENYVAKVLFPNDDYQIIQRTHDYTANKNGFIETSKNPDFKFRSRKSGKEFWVEAKYRSNLFHDMVDWCKPYQLKRYKEQAERTLVLVVIGLGDTPGSPDQVFIIPVTHIRYTGLYPSFIKKYRVLPHRRVTEYDLIKILAGKLS